MFERADLIVRAPFQEEDPPDSGLNDMVSVIRRLRVLVGQDGANYAKRPGVNLRGMIARAERQLVATIGRQRARRGAVQLFQRLQFDTFQRALSMEEAERSRTPAQIAAILTALQTDLEAELAANDAE